MDFAKLFQSIEDAVYEVMVWILLLPKTLLRSMFQPKWAIKYVHNEWEKKPDERFDEYLSPVLLWLMVAVLPLSLFTILGNTDIQSLDDVGKAFKDGLLSQALYALIIPFTYIVWMEWVNKRPVKKSTLKRSFYMHCYALAPAQFLFGLSAFMTIVSDIFYIFSFISIILLAIYEAFVFQSELEISYKKAFLYAIAPQVALVLLFILLIIIVVATGF